MCTFVLQNQFFHPIICPCSCLPESPRTPHFLNFSTTSTNRGLRNGVHRNGVPERRSTGRNGAGTPFITSARNGNGNGVPKSQERLKERPFPFLGGYSISRGEYFARKLKLEPNGRQKHSLLLTITSRYI